MSRLAGAPALLCAALLAGPPAARAAPGPELPSAEPGDPWSLPQASLEWCDALVARFPRSFVAYGCYMLMAWKGGKLGSRLAAIEHLQRRVRRHPEDYLARYQLAVAAQDDGQLDLAEEHQRAAAAGASRDGHAEAEVWARTALSITLCADGRFSEGAAELALADAAASRSGTADLVSLAQVWSAGCAFHEADYGRAIGLLQETRARLEAGPPTWRTAWVKQLTLGRLVDALSAVGRHGEAYELALGLVDHITSPYSKAAARHSVAAEAAWLADAGALGQEEADRLLHEALDAEVKVGVRLWLSGGEFYTRLLLARRLGATAEGLAEAEKALAMGRRERDKVVIGEALRLLAVFTSQRDPANPAAALAFADEAVALAHGSGLRGDDVRARLSRAWVLWHAGRSDEAARESRAALDALDRLRARQPDQLLGARAASDLAGSFRLLAAAALEAGGAPARVALSFEVMERLRARALSDALGTVRATATPPTLQARQRELEAELVRTQRRLLAASGEERAALLAGLERVEEQVEELRDRIAHAVGLPPAGAGAPPGLAALQAELEPGEAFLGYQVWGAASAGPLPAIPSSSWVLVVTHAEARAVRIPDAPELALQTELLAALLERRDGSEFAGAVRLYRSLVAPALDALPPGISRLWIAPDGPLHQLPFGALRADAGAAPLGTTHQLSLVPSAALLLRWRGAPSPPAPVPLLALADPPALGAASSRRDAGAPSAEGPLPWARAEALAAAATLGGGSRALLGDDASEASLKGGELRRFGVLHFATHARIDAARPDRSALVLAPGGPEEDGLLQLREVAALDLTGAAVVLAACRSSAGTLLQGEGLLGLTRAFFLARADAVVGSLWPLRDDESALLFAAFYERLAEGASVAEALRGASQQRFLAGAPAAAWSGVLVLGHGGRAPVVAARARPRPVRLLALLGVGGLGAAMLLWLRAARRRSRDA